MMKPEEIKRVVEETERRWRERTPAKTISDANASYRVATSEIILWGNQNGINVDRMDEDYQEANTRLFFRLRREFPDETWDVLNSATREFCKRRGIPIPRKSAKKA
jgi:hypothetical protein